MYRLFCIMRTGRLFPPDIVCYWALPHFPHRARRSFSRTCFCRVSSRRDVTERQEVAERIGLAAERAFQCAQPEADDVCFLHSVKGVELSPVSIKREQHNWATEEQKRYIRCCRSGSRRRRLYRTGCQKYRSDLPFCSDTDFGIYCRHAVTFCLLKHIPAGDADTSTKLPPLSTNSQTGTHYPSLQF